MAEHSFQQEDGDVSSAEPNLTRMSSGDGQVNTQHARFYQFEDIKGQQIKDDGIKYPLSAEKTSLEKDDDADSEFSFHSVSAMRNLAIRDTVSRLRELQRNKKPLFICKLIVTYPKTALGVTLSLHVGMLVVTGILFAVGYDIIPMHFSSLPLDIRTDEDYLQGLAWAYKTKKTNLVNRLEDYDARQDERSTRAEAIELYFEIPGGNVFTRDNLKKMREVTHLFSRNKDYRERLCYVEAGKCVEPYSVFDFFDKFEAKMPGSNASEFVDIPKVLTTVQQYAPSALQMFLGKNAEITATMAHSSITRVVILFGKPLAGYKNAYDRSEAQDETIKQFILSDFKPLMESLFRERVGQMDFFYNSLSLFLNKIDTQVMADLKLALGSLCFIFVFMFVQTGSLWVTCLAMLSVVTSFCGANLIYRVVLDYRYFGAFHVLAVFIILAVGADDTFVFFDTWKLSSHFTYPTLAHRLSNCYRKAGLAMFFTSVTTAVAFGLSAISPFLGISSFGIFSALLVCMNYLSVVTYFPAVVTTYHLYWEAATCLCCRRKKDGGDNNDEDTGAFSEEAFMQGYSAMRFFRGPFFTFITNRYSRVVILTAFFVLIPLSLYFSYTLKVDEEKMKFLDEKSNFGAYLKKREQAFRSVNQDRTSHVFIVWGLKKQSLAMCHQTNVTCYGHTVWDNEFDLNQPESQIAVVRMCDTLKSLSEEHAKVLGLRSNIATKEREVDCFIQDMLHFLQEEESRMHVNETTGAKLRVYPKDTVFHFPVGKEEARTIMTYNPHIYKQPLPKWFNRYFEVVVGFWLNNGFRPGQSRYRYKRYYSLLGEVEVPGTTLDVQVEQPGKDPTNKTFFYGTRLAFAAISVNLSISGDNLNYNLGMYMLQAWNHLIGEKMRTMPRLLRRGFQCALGPPEGDGSIKNIWHWMKVQAQLTNSAFVGIIVGLCTALPILLWATGNVIVALLSLMTIIFITFSVIAVIPLMHWKLGVLESLNLVLLVGLAVEFVIHLSEAYARSEHHGRLGRTQDTLSEVGFSVLSGAFSSLGASFFLLLAKIVFLVEFGVFMFCTVGFSILYSLLFFTTVLGIIGPERRFGNVSSVVTWVKYFWERRAKRKRRPPQPWAMAQQKRAATDTSL